MNTYQAAPTAHELPFRNLDWIADVSTFPFKPLRHGGSTNPLNISNHYEKSLHHDTALIPGS
jgi:hypothetical protein